MTDLIIGGVILFLAVMAAGTLIVATTMEQIEHMKDKGNE